MPMATAKSDKVNQEDQEVLRLTSWRKDAWLALGYRGAWADFLADTQVDVHTAAKMLSQGATHDQVVRILGGSGPLAGMDSKYDWDKHFALLLGKEIEPVEATEDEVEVEEPVQVGAGDEAAATD